MSKVSMTTKVPVEAEKVWELIGGFGALSDWHPAVEKTELEQGGTIRRLSLVGGGTIVERLERSDEGEHVYSYSILESPLPVANYTAELRVKTNADGSSSVEWSSTFEPSGASENDASEVIRGIYQAGFDNMKKLMGL